MKVRKKTTQLVGHRLYRGVKDPQRVIHIRIKEQGEDKEIEEGGVEKKQEKINLENQ